MTACVHKLLIFAGNIIESTVLPIRYFGEKAAESRNKFYKFGRLHHARKDVFHRATDTLDRRIQGQKRMNLSLEVLDLLECSSNQDDNTALEDERPFNVLDLEH